MHALAHEYPSRNISPWGGIKLFQQTCAHSGLRDDLLAVELPQGKSNSAHNAVDLVEGFLVSTVLGARRTSHVGMLRTDEVVREIFGWKCGLGDLSTYTRFFRKFSIVGNDMLFTELMRRWLSRMEVRNLTIDVDSTVITRYGQQEGAEVGYNPAKHGRASHHPLMALFKQKVMTNSRVQHQLSTIRFQCIAIGSYLVKNGRNKVMKLSAEGRRRHFLEHFFDQVELLKPPFKFAIA